MSADSTDRFEDSSAAQQQFLSLFLRSEREIFRYVAALVPNMTDAEDIVQQTAMALWQKFDDYDPAQPFTPWACRFALNKTRQWIERRQRWQALLNRGLAEELAQRREELQPELEQRLRRLETCLRKLPQSRRSWLRGITMSVPALRSWLSGPAGPRPQPTRCSNASGTICNFAWKARRTRRRHDPGLSLSGV
jgi:RNA polymerase sigma-70 factor (ECF subfamily)